MRIRFLQQHTSVLIVQFCLSHCVILLFADSTSSHMKTQNPVAILHHTESSAPPLFTIESAGFQQCMAQLTSYMHKITPAQRTSLIEGLKHHTKTQQPNPESSQKVAETDRTAVTPVEAICTSDSKEECPKLLLPSHSPFQPHSCSTPCHDYLSPPPSPWFSPSFSTYAVSPSLPSFASHFPFPPSLSPPSSNISFFSLSPTVPHAGPSAFYFPPLTTPRSPSHLALRQESAVNSSSMWRPWSRD